MRFFFSLCHHYLYCCLLGSFLFLPVLLLRSPLLLLGPFAFNRTAWQIHREEAKNETMRRERNACAFILSPVADLANNSDIVNAQDLYTKKKEMSF